MTALLFIIPAIFVLALCILIIALTPSHTKGTGHIIDRKPINK